LAGLSDFDYALPEERIAQAPPEQRDAARMLVVDRASGAWQDRLFRNLPEFVGPGDCVVLNNSRVIPSRLLGKTVSGARVQFLLLKAIGPLRWTALGRPGRRLLPRDVVTFDAGVSAEIIETRERGERVLQFRGVSDNAALGRFLDEHGHVPLPPYIHRPDDSADRARYQTVFARPEGSVAAPTAGLHFTSLMLERIRGRGAEIAEVTLHVGLGTFQPIEREDFENHQLHTEHFEIGPDAWSQIERAGRVLAVGTTAVRTIESAARQNTLSGETQLFLYPGASFLRTGAMLTNFHLPKSSLLLLVCAFGGTDLILRAYRHAVEARYRFFSYGDCMLIL
jgi:S-adenosylmethionine:tRNA ribosyltransferase-isomerase